jgi:hypothetical protein
MARTDTSHHAALMISQSLRQQSNKVGNDRVWILEGGDVVRRTNFDVAETEALIAAARELQDPDLIEGILEAYEEEVEHQRMGFSEEAAEIFGDFAKEFGVDEEWYNKPSDIPPSMVG